MLALAALGLVPACGVDTIRPDAGYRGTWSRGNERNVSILAITDIGGQWRFRWTKRSYDGKFAVLCDWDGHCEERLNGELTATYSIATRFENDRLYTDTVEERVVPERRTFRYTDVMEVTDAGRTLWNYTTDRDGQAYTGRERPQRSFAKVSDSIADPPRATR
jgi:hypothetical protein